jgi:hypothetical protein
MPLFAFRLRAAPFRGPRQEAVVPRKWQTGKRDLPRQHAEALAIHDLALVGRPAGRHRSGFGNGEAQPKGVPQLHPVQ